MPHIQAVGPRIVVGLDGSTYSLQSLDWAAAEAERGRLLLTLCHVIAVPLPEFHLPGVVTSEDRDRDEQLLGRAKDQVMAHHRDLTVRQVIRSGLPGEQLLLEAQPDGTLVVGARAHSNLTSLLAGSISDDVLTHCTAPIIVVRGESGLDNVGPVLLGMDTDTAETVVQMAFESAAAAGAAVRVLHARNTVVGPGAPPPPDRQEDDATKHQLLARMQPCRQKYPDVPVEVCVAHADPGHALTEASTTSRLVILGTHVRTSPGAVLFGSVSRYLAHHAHCPVAVVRD